MKNVFLSIALIPFVSSLAFAKVPGPGAAPDKDCLKKIVAAVNKHHTLAQGRVYALRQIYNGQSAFAVLVGHSDESDPTDYLVTTEHKDCKIASIVYTNDASDVEEYTKDERID
ncbi:MAG TPA: hypothetical protein VM901_07865 [Bdellovibrionota bacterium]|jgi:hypothetical protein|nr:hypothetical protein [Bdellovibrionota bacterium]